MYCNETRILDGMKPLDSNCKWAPKHVWTPGQYKIRQWEIDFISGVQIRSIEIFGLEIDESTCISTLKLYFQLINNNNLICKRRYVVFRKQSIVISYISKLTRITPQNSFVGRIVKFAYIHAYFQVRSSTTTSCSMISFPCKLGKLYTVSIHHMRALASTNIRELYK